MDYVLLVVFALALLSIQMAVIWSLVDVIRLSRETTPAEWLVWLVAILAFNGVGTAAYVRWGPGKGRLPF